MESHFKKQENHVFLLSKKSPNNSSLAPLADSLHGYHWATIIDQSLDYSKLFPTSTVDGSEIWRENQLRLADYPIICRVLAPFQVVVWDFWTINSMTSPNGIIFHQDFPEIAGVPWNPSNSYLKCSAFGRVFGLDFIWSDFMLKMSFDHSKADN